MRIARAQISDRSVRYVRVLEQSEILVCAVSPREEKIVPEDIALFIDFENIRYSMLNIQRREPDPQELIAVARRYGTVMVARAYADWSRQPEPFKGSLTAAMIDRVDCPAKQRDRIRMGTIHYTTSNTPTGGLGAQG